ncbi:MAG: hypothetical protein IE909_08685 [Campylobacterales bacterium]|nr:hypothetical protein [Campylobacterales bacterium]
MKDYTRDTINLLVETIDDEMVVSHMDINPTDLLFLVTYLISKLSDLSGLDHNEILEDLKLKEK